MRTLHAGLLAFPLCLVATARAVEVHQLNTAVDGHWLYLPATETVVIMTAFEDQTYVFWAHEEGDPSTLAHIREITRDDGITSGTLKIMGGIEELGINGSKKNGGKKNPLMKAELDGTWSINADGDLVGFNTMNIVCHDKISAYCTEAESFYLNLLESITTGKPEIKTAGIAVTTIPVPAAIWLFGSGLLGLLAVSRRKSLSRAAA